jgi:hypothetical protein
LKERQNYQISECIFPETNFLGGGLTAEEGGQGIATDSHEACSIECQRRPQCNYWTFVDKWKVNCYLKSKLGEKTEFESISGTYGSLCGIKTCSLQFFKMPLQICVLLRSPYSRVGAVSTIKETPHGSHLWRHHHRLYQ